MKMNFRFDCIGSLIVLILVALLIPMSIVPIAHSQGDSSVPKASPIYPIVRAPLPAGIKLDANVYVTMRDYIKIAVDIYRPEKDGRYPALLSMSPYIKELQQWPPILTHSIEAGNTPFFVSNGYVHVIAQIRGTGLSQGQYNYYSIKEHQDGYDLVEWIAQQPWCNGNVGMLGDSYFGMTQWLVAGQRPPHLKCIAPYEAKTDIYRDTVYEGGHYGGMFFSQWALDTLYQAFWPGPVEGKLPPANFIADMLSNPFDGPYYWERSGWTKIDKIEIPVLAMTTPGSSHSQGMLRSYPKIKGPKKLLVLPNPGFYAHVLLIRSRPLNEYILKWFDHWLKGVNNGIMEEPEVTIFDPGTNEWRYEDKYPLARTTWTKFYLRSNPAGPANNPPYGLISGEVPSEVENPDTYTTPDEKEVMSRKPVIAYSTSPLTKDLRVWGPLSTIIYGSTTTKDTTWFVHLGDQGPDGKVNFLSWSNLKASLREVDESKSEPGNPFHPFRNPSLPEPNKIYKFEIGMKPIFHTFKAGHKIWLQIQSDDANYQTRLHTVYNAEMLPFPGKNTVHHDSINPSHLLLPIITDAPVMKPVGAPVSQIRWPLE
jgi:predicted acyl esterase